MNHRIILMMGICVQIATASDCNRLADLSFETIACCSEAWNEMDIFNDPCYQIAEEGEIATSECMIDCFYSSHGFFTNGSFVLENATRYLRSFGSKEFQDTFIGAFERCSKFELDELTVKFGHLIQDPGESCSPMAATFDSCIAVNVISRCPKHMWSENDFCTSERNFMNECIFTS